MRLSKDERREIDERVKKEVEDEKHKRELAKYEAKKRLQYERPSIWRQLAETGYKEIKKSIEKK